MSVVVVALVTAVALALAVGTPVAVAGTSSVNGSRSAAGLPPLSGHAGLDGLAADHSRAMAARGSLFHTPNLPAAVGRVVPDWIRVGENVGVGPSLADVEADFETSSVHRANIRGDFTLVGVGAVRDDAGKVWVTQVFAKAPANDAPAESAPAPPQRASRSAPRAAPAPTAPRPTAPRSPSPRPA
ncbi:MAG: CAP domain-containing protein, partial [Actinomycetota bacterium]|nr:CAP domain-containing protein [Actinomycetota bacterium]